MFTSAVGVQGPGEGGAAFYTRSAQLVPYYDLRATLVLVRQGLCAGNDLDRQVNGWHRATDGG